MRFYAKVDRVFCTFIFGMWIVKPLDGASDLDDDVVLGINNCEMTQGLM